MKTRNIKKKVIFGVKLIMVILSALLIFKAGVYMKASTELPKINAAHQGKYYFNQLSTMDKARYDKIYNSVINMEPTTNFILYGNSANLAKIVRFVSNDNPDIFYLETATANIDILQNTKIVYGYYMEPEEVEQAKGDIAAYELSVFAKMKRGMSEYEKEKVIYDYISEHTWFEHLAKYNQGLYSVVKGRSVCYGYSQMFKYLCNKAGIECITVTGTHNGEPHAWNEVKIDEEWYVVDPSNNKNTYEVNNKTHYLWFNITTDQQARSCVTDDWAEVPECTSVEYEYYNQNDLYFTEVDLDKLSQLIDEDDDGYLIIRCNNYDTYDRMSNAINEDEAFMNKISSLSDSHLVSYDETLIFKLTWNPLSIDISDMVYTNN